MLVKMDELVKTISTALDIVESNLLGCSANHGKRISTLCAAMGRHLGLDEDEISAITTCAMFHDNALTEYILSERPGPGQDINLVLHCRYGQRNVGTLPLRADASDYILFHHEQPDGNGPFRRRDGEFSLGAELIAIADMVDVEFHLQTIPPDRLPEVHQHIKELTGTRYTKRAADAMLSVLDEEMLLSLRDDRIVETAEKAIPSWDISINDTTSIAVLTARIVNYKSEYTKEHSTQSADIVWNLCAHYNLDLETRAQIYLAAALHDLGKLQTPTEILEKPGKLTAAEFDVIKNHALHTHDLLSTIPGFENICKWASCHHEKLDGSGYPFGKEGDDLDFPSRLIACSDIYEAVGSKRPYHDTRTHEETMEIMYEMASGGLIDKDITSDIDLVMTAHLAQHARL
ncbi:MAG: HD domain-containing protein [Coriobacteriia bacterium]|nr:HD domain-containing protein [Coriobacteriia bacterium]